MKTEMPSGRTFLCPPPWGEALCFVFDFRSLSVNPSTHLELASAQFLTHLQPGINCPLQVPLQTTAKVPEHGGTSRQNDVLQTSKQDGRALTAAT